MWLFMRRRRVRAVRPSKVSSWSDAILLFVEGKLCQGREAIESVLVER